MNRFCRLSVVLCLLAAMTGCAARTEKTLIQQPVTAWPENEFTGQIVPPEAGTPSYMITDADGSFFCICYQEITREEGEAYLERLCDAGYSVTEWADEDNVLLQRENTYLSVSCTDGALVVSISFL